MTYAEFGIAYWRIWRDQVYQLAPHLNSVGLLQVISDCRGEQGALWQGLDGSLGAERDLLRFHLCDAYQRLTGRPWPILDDLPPTVPDDVSALVD